MATFSGLPSEVLLMILLMVSIDDIENFTLASKKLHNLGTDRLQRHLQLKRKYSFCNLTKDDESYPIIMKFLGDVLKNPEIASYVKELSIERWIPEWTTTNDHWRDQRLEDNINAAVLRLVPKQDIQEWHEAIGSGDEDPAITLLLLSLPELGCLNIQNIGETSNFFYATLNSIATGDSNVPLSRLTHVRLHSPRSSFITSLDPVIRFARLPSVRSITALNIWTCEPYDFDRLRLAPRSSNVSDLAFDSSDISPKLFYAFIEGFRALRSFTYKVTTSERFAYSARECDPYWMRVALLAHATSTLETLKLVCHAAENPYLGDMASFHTLRHLDIELRSMIRYEDMSNSRSLINALPTTLETLVLRITFQDSYHDSIPRMMLALAKFKQNLTPNLREVKIRAHYSATVCYNDIVEDYASKGIRLTIWQPSDPDEISACERKDVSDEEHESECCTCRETFHEGLIACDNSKCPFSPFHLSCAGLATEPSAAWLCKDCQDELKNDEALSGETGQKISDGLALLALG